MISCAFCSDFITVYLEIRVQHNQNTSLQGQDWGHSLQHEIRNFALEPPLDIAIPMYPQIQRTVQTTN